MFANPFEDILRRHCTSSAVRDIETGASPAALWNAIENAGFLELLTREEDGGAGLPLADFFPILSVIGRYAVPVPVAQAMAVRALLPAAAIPPGMLTIAPALRTQADGAIVCPLVPFGLVAQQVLADDGQDLLLLPCETARRAPARVHGSLVANLTWQPGAKPLRFARSGDQLAAFGAALHAALLCGAMGRIFEMALAYGNDRVQFGKSIGKFQAIQHQLSVMAEQIAAARMAAEAAFRGTGSTPSLLAAAIAKARASEAVVQVASIAHAVHGAIGVTEEYDLQLFTRRLHEWRMAHGSEAHWHPVVGRAVLAASSNITEFVRSSAL